MFAGSKPDSASITTGAGGLCVCALWYLKHEDALPGRVVKRLIPTSLAGAVDTIGLAAAQPTREAGTIWVYVKSSNGIHKVILHYPSLLCKYPLRMPPIPKDSVWSEVFVRLTRS